MKMVEFNLCLDTNDAFEICWDNFMSTQNGIDFLESLKDFLIAECMFFSPNL